MNMVILIGRVGADPEFNRTQSGTSICRLRIATSEKYADDSGKIVEQTQWHNVKVWGKQADSCVKYVKKGMQVSVNGKITYRKHEDKYYTDIIAQRVQFLDKIQTNEPPTENIDIPF